MSSKAGRGAGQASRRLQGPDENFWPSDRADSQNTGSVPGPGPGSSPGYCRYDWLNSESPQEMFPLNIWATGIGSSKGSEDSAVYFGDAEGVFWLFEDLGSDAFEMLSVAIPQLDLNLNSLTGYDDFLAAPAAVYLPATEEDQIVAASLDGHVYSMSEANCVGFFAAGGGVEGARARVKAWREGRPVRAGGGGRAMQVDDDPPFDDDFNPANCYLWYYTSPTSQPFPNSPLISTSLNSVFVIESNGQLATGGVLRALNLTSGNETVWAAPWVAQYPPGSGTMYPLVSVTPAMSPLSAIPDSQLVLPVGPGIVVLNGATGTVLGNVDTLTANGNCPAIPGELFTSSVSILINASTPGATPPQAQLFAQSQAGNLWSWQMTGDGNSSAITFTCLFACAYKPGDSACFQPTQSAVSYAPGGWYQASTPAEVAALHEAIRAEHRKVHGPEAGLRVGEKFGKGSLWNGIRLPNADMAVAELARQLPPDVLDALVPKGAPHYRRQASNGHAVGSRQAPLQDAFGGTWAVSTPAISRDGALVAFNQWQGVSKLASNGLMIVQANSVAGQSSAWMYNIVGYDIDGNEIPYARSRSSPAWDGDRKLYAAADWFWGYVDGTGDVQNSTIPGLVVLDCSGASPALVWAMDLGFPSSGTIGLASPILLDSAYTTEHRLMIAGTGGSFHAVDGCPAKCPSSNPLQTCSGHSQGGDGCDGDSGQCTCAPAWSKDNMCYAFVGCGHGTMDYEGFCACEGCWDYNVNGTCTIPHDCQNGGACKKSGDYDSVCLCPFCYNNTYPDDDCTVGPNTAACGAGAIGCAVDQCICDEINCYKTSDDGMSCVTIDCGPGGTCGAGTCFCDPCWDSDDSGACTVQRDCGAGGECDPTQGTSGTCASNGDYCWLYDRVNDKYDTRQTCGNHGTCFDATGHCQCNVGWANSSIPTPCTACDGCHSGPNCKILNTCNLNGVCLVTGSSQRTHLCACNEGWGGTDCDTPVSNGPGGAVSPAVAAGVGIPMALLGAAAVGFYYMRVRKGAAYVPLGVTPAVSAGGAGAAGQFKPSSSSGGGKGGKGGFAPTSFSTISKSAGFESDGAKAAVSRLGSLLSSASTAVAGSSGGTGAGERSGLLHSSSAGTAGASAASSGGFAASAKGSYGGL